MPHDHDHENLEEVFIALYKDYQELLANEELSNMTIAILKRCLESFTTAGQHVVVDVADLEIQNDEHEVSWAIVSKVKVVNLGEGNFDIEIIE